MNERDATEIAYKNGYAKGYADARKNSVEIDELRAWLYAIATNNVGCVLEGDFSDACKEIISRLDKLPAFVQDRRALNETN